MRPHRGKRKRRKRKRKRKKKRERGSEPTSSSPWLKAVGAPRTPESSGLTNLGEPRAEMGDEMPTRLPG